MHECFAKAPLSIVAMMMCLSYGFGARVRGSWRFLDVSQFEGVDARLNLCNCVVAEVMSLRLILFVGSLVEW